MVPYARNLQTVVLHTQASILRSILRVGRLLVGFFCVFPADIVPKLGILLLRGPRCFYGPPCVSGPPMFRGTAGRHSSQSPELTSLLFSLFLFHPLFPEFLNASFTKFVLKTPAYSNFPIRFAWVSNYGSNVTQQNHAYEETER